MAAPAPAASATRTRFKLSRWFAVVAMVSIGHIALALGVLLDRFIAQRLLRQEAVLTQEFVQSLVQVDKPLQANFANPALGMNADAEAAFAQIAAMPDMLRANVYDALRRVIWSSEPALAGRSFGRNRELDEALGGRVVTQFGDAAAAQPTLSDKAEHQDMHHLAASFVEIYVPVRDAGGHQVLAVIEFYKQPRALHLALAELRVNIALGASVSAVLLFAALFGLVRRADRTMLSQQRQLVDQETLAAIGEVSAAVAHGIRNPLASMRSSAELIPGGDLAQAHEAAADIVAQTDRLEAWIGELLAYTRPLNEAPAPVALPALVARCLSEFARDMQRRHIRSDTLLAPKLPAVRGDALLLGQVLASLLSNAIEAMQNDGLVNIRGAVVPGQEGVTLSLQVSGPGMTPAQLARAGKPFHTTKAQGLGVGLALARRVVERFGGRLDIHSSPGHSTTVCLHLLAA